MWKIKKHASAGKYFYAFVPEHPKANKHGYVYEHRIIMENSIRRLLRSNEVVHHKNGDGKDNRIDNLELLTASEHQKLHARKQGAVWVQYRCLGCNQIFEKPRNKTHLIKGGNFTYCSRRCSGRGTRFDTENILSTFIKYPQ